MPLLDSFRRRLADRIAPASDPSRRDFVRRTAGAGAAVLGVGLLSDEALAASQERAARFGIAPGTVVDARGRPKDPGVFEPMVGQIMAFGADFVPHGWTMCDGRTLDIEEYRSLWAVLAFTYSEAGVERFALPDLRGRALVGYGHGPGLSPRPHAAKGGAETVTLAPIHIPDHTHDVPSTTLNSKGESASGATPGDSGGPTSLLAGHIAPDGTHASRSSGGGQPLATMSPFLAVTYCIAVEGVMPRPGRG